MFNNVSKDTFLNVLLRFWINFYDFSVILSALSFPYIIKKGAHISHTLILHFPRVNIHWRANRIEKKMTVLPYFSPPLLKHCFKSGSEIEPSQSLSLVWESGGGMKPKAIGDCCGNQSTIAFSSMLKYADMHWGSLFLFACNWEELP